MENDPELRKLAREIAEEHPYVESEIPEHSELTLSAQEIQDCAIYLNISPDQLVLELSVIDDNLGGGLSSDGKRQWFISRIGDGMTIEEILADAESLKHSPAT